MLPASALPDTVAVHAGRDDLAALGVHVPPIDLSTTNPLPSVGLGGDSYEALATGGTPISGGSHVYQRLWNPTTARFEEALARMEDTQAAVAFASGMAAITACLLAVAAEGKRHVVAVRPLYGGSDHLLASGLLGTEVTWAAADGIAAARRPDTGLVILETPGNPTLELLDLARVAEQCGEVPLLVDNTFATPVLQRPADFGATLVVHSATKYLGGHGDVLAGAVATTEEWAGRLRPIRAITGSVLHPLSSYLLHRGLQTLPLRVRHQSQNAQKLVDRLLANPAVGRVYYPGLPECDPQHLVGRQMTGPGAVFAMEVRGGYEAAARVADSVRLITHAVSLGGVDTLIQHPASLTHRPVAAAAKPHASVLRISVGLEDPEDLYADLERALRS
ncbi:PLP-dependent transferase [Catenulispora sp. NF23]|uniref:PLP-dependent transferase n=1 Tax=Catenulispora pinistramenti TaxID=2705254 RepID=A0ABS5L5F1_9ACTN|nr:PLP-dependent aspartate aminotransferase family protein [Catenulispora pinistramenti]MBS2534881.1 PLP-dependent transferase [Catenulispora pinistramenti]MBS2553571.1 PLP-dependent transferase [Catenulispora pinistramenti]